MNDIPRVVGHAYEKLLADREASSKKRRVYMSLGGDQSGLIENENNSRMQIDPLASASNTADDNDLNHIEGVAERGGLDALILDIEIRNGDGMVVSNLYYGEVYTIRSRCQIFNEIDSINLSLRIQTVSGLGLYAINTSLQDLEFSAKPGMVIELSSSFRCVLHQGHYMVGGGVSRKTGPSSFETIHFLVDGFSFFVVDQGPFSGYVDLQWKLDARGILEP